MPYIPGLNALGSFVFQLLCGQTDRQTDRNTDANERLKPRLHQIHVAGYKYPGRATCIRLHVDGYT